MENGRDGRNGARARSRAEAEIGRDHVVVNNLETEGWSAKVTENSSRIAQRRAAQVI